MGTNRREKTAERIKQILRDDLGVDAGVLETTSLETPLFGRGIGLDSMETLTLVAGIEREFEIVIPDGDLKVELFRDLGRLADYVLGRTKAGEEDL